MSLWRIAWRSIQQRALASGLTALSVGLGVALVVAVLVIHSVIDHSFQRGSQGYDLIVGAKGGRLGLVLNSVFYLGEPVENIPYEVYEKLRHRAGVKTAVPICMGHAYQRVPVIATEPKMFTELKYLGDKKYQFAEGRNFKRTSPYEAVAGWTAAKETGLKLGDEFRPVGVGPSVEESGHEDLPFTIVGILAPTGTPNDRALFINIEGFFTCPAHAAGPQPASSSESAEEPTEKEKAPEDDPSQDDHPHEHGDDHEHDHAEDHEHDAPHDPDSREEGHEDHAGEHAHDHEEDHADDQNAETAGEQEAEHVHSEACEHGADCEHGHEHEHHRELTALLVITDMEDKPMLASELYNEINDGPDAQAVRPAQEIADLFEGIIGNVQIVLLILAVLVVVVTGIGILVSIYNSMSDRRHEIAVMRALGARRRTVMSIILLESILLALGGGLLGVLLGHGLIGALSPLIAEKTMVIVRPWDFQLVELILLPGLILLATIVGYLPAVVAYKTDVARSLTATG